MNRDVKSPSCAPIYAATPKWFDTNFTCLWISPLPNYEVESTKEGKTDIPIGDRAVHIVSSTDLASGRSTVFSIPKEHLAKDLRLRISINFDWEDRNDVFAGREVEHFVYFSSASLPKGVVKESNWLGYLVSLEHRQRIWFSRLRRVATRTRIVESLTSIAIHPIWVWKRNIFQTFNTKLMFWPCR